MLHQSIASLTVLVYQPFSNIPDTLASCILCECARRVPPQERYICLMLSWTLGPREITCLLPSLIFFRSLLKFHFLFEGFPVHLIKISVFVPTAYLTFLHDTYEHLTNCTD